MRKNVNIKFKKKHWAWGWGVFLLLAAALVLANQFGGFIELGFWSLLVSALAVAFLIQSIVNLSFSVLPIPIAALYYIFQTPLGLPEISFWPLVLVTLLATAGLSALLPNRLFRRKVVYSSDSDRRKEKYRKKYGGRNIVDEIVVDIEDAVEDIVDGVGDVVEHIKDDDDVNIEEGGGENNPRISVQFTGVSRYLHADCLETVELDCKFGGLEVYFDHVQLSPNGAEAFLDCKCGAIELYVPSHWRIIDNMNASLGACNIQGQRRTPDEDAPTLKISGNVALGGVEVHRI